MIRRENTEIQLRLKRQVDIKKKKKTKDKFARKVLDRKTAFQQGGLVGQVETTQTHFPHPNPPSILRRCKKGEIVKAK